MIRKPPFLLKQEGWGEFDMEIVLAAIDRGGDHTIHHDLNFREERYETTHSMVCLPKRILSCDPMAVQ